MTSSGTAIRRIPLARPDVGPRELELVTEVLTSDTLAMGPFTLRFEEGIAALAGRKYGIACSSGTAGLHMAVRALGVGAGDEVITTPFSFVASANCFLYERADAGLRRHRGGQPRARSGPDRGGGHAAATKAILPVHVFGRPCRIDADRQPGPRPTGWAIIEDSCEGLGSSIERPPARQLRRHLGLRVLSQQADHDRRGRHGRHRRSGPGRGHAEPAQPGPGHGWDLAAPRPPRLQLPDRRAVGGGRRRPGRATGRDAGRTRPGGRKPTGEALGGRDWVRLPSAGPDEEVDWFVYVVRLAQGIDRDRSSDGWPRSASRRGRTSPDPPPALLSARPSASSPVTSR